MAWFEDLQPCTPFESEWKRPIAVGWLAKGHAFAQGPRDRELAQRLNWQLAEASEHERAHPCDLCEAEVARSGKGVLFVPGVDCVFVAPELIGHYVAKHGYAPPRVFIDAMATAASLSHVDYRASLGRHSTRPVDDSRGPREWLAEDIRVFESHQAIRRRPGMYIGSTGRDGLTHLLFEAVTGALHQLFAGQGTELRVVVESSGWVTIEDDGAGLSVDQIERPALQGGFFLAPGGPSKPIATARRETVRLREPTYAMPLVRALSARLEIETRRDGIGFGAQFSAGRLMRPIVSTGPTTQRGTRIRYLADDELFDEGATLELQRVESRLMHFSSLAPHLRFFFQGVPLTSDGLPGLVRTFAADLVPETLLSVHDAIDEVDVDIALGWSPTAKRRIQSFVNYAETREGGAHVDGLDDAIRGGAPTTVDAERVLGGLVAVVHVGLSGPEFSGASRAFLVSDEARAAVNRAALEAMRAAPWWWDRLHEVIK
jgi:DNA gyrase B